MLTKAKICYDLHNTPYTHNMVCGDQKITLHFSSEMYLTKFKQRSEHNRKSIRDSLWNRFGININTDLIADLRLYHQLEKRGYLISVDGEKITCQNNIILDGPKLITKSSQE